MKTRYKRLLARLAARATQAARTGQTRACGRLRALARTTRALAK